MANYISFSVEVMRYFMYLISPIGIMVSLWGYRKSKKGGYIALTIYFLLGIVLPPLHTYMENHDPTYVEFKKNIDEANKVAMSVLEQKTHQKIEQAPHVPVVNIQFGEIILLVGVILLVSKERAKSSEQITAPDAAEPRR